MAGRTRLRARFSGAGRWLPLLGAVLVIASLAAPVLFLVLMLGDRQRSFLVEAQTGRIVLVFGDGPNQWRLPDATLCLPVAVPRPAADDACGAAFAPDGPAREWLIDWAEDETVTLQIEPEGTLTIATVGGTRDIPEGARLIIAADIWTEVGTLVFQAKTTLGADMATGTRHYLWSGRWEAREAGIATLLFRSQTEVVKSGDLSAGANVGVMIGDDAALSYGHIARRADDGPMNVMLLSEFADTALVVRHYGVGQAVRIWPDWVDVATSSPLLIALAAVFPVLGSIGLFLFEMGRRTEVSNGRRTRE